MLRYPPKKMRISLGGAKKKCCLSLLCLLCLLVSCPWDPYPPDPFDRPWKLELERLWTAELGPESVLQPGIHACDGTYLYLGVDLYVENETASHFVGRLFRVRMADGDMSIYDPRHMAEQRGYQSTNESIQNILIDEAYGRVYVVGWNGNPFHGLYELFCFSQADLSLLWKIDLSSPGWRGDFIDTVPELYGDYVIMPFEEYKEMGRGAGSSFWVIKRDSADGQALCIRSFTSSLLNIVDHNYLGDTYYLRTCGSFIMGLDMDRLVNPGFADTDCVLFDFPYPKDDPTVDGGFNNCNVVFTDDLYIYVHDDRLMARRIDDNTEVWSFLGDTVHADGVNLVYGDRVIFPTLYGIVYCLNAATGALLWKSDTTPYDDFTMYKYHTNIYSEPTVIDGKYVAIADGASDSLTFIDIQTGEKVLCHRTVFSATAPRRSTFYVDGILYQPEMDCVSAYRIREK
jgi:outer membrane protein assembly factor BamB